MHQENMWQEYHAWKPFMSAVVDSSKLRMHQRVQMSVRSEPKHLRYPSRKTIQCSYKSSIISSPLSPIKPGATTLNRNPCLYERSSRARIPAIAEMTCAGCIPRRRATDRIALRAIALDVRGGDA